MPDCSTRPGAINFGTQVSSPQGPIPPSSAPGDCFLGCCRSWPGLWPSRSSRICTFPFLRRERPPGQVPEQCFPCDIPSGGLTNTHHVSFASGATIMGDEPPLEQSPDICIHEVDEMDIVSVETDVPNSVLRPPPGFRPFSWPWEKRGTDGDPSLFNFSKELPGWFPWGYGGQSVDPPSLPISPIIQDSLDDSVVVNVGSSREEPSTPSTLDVLDQYALSLQGTASKILEQGLDSRGFPSAEVVAGALGPRVRRASVQLEAMGLWRPSLDPVMMP